MAFIFPMLYAAFLSYQLLRMVRLLNLTIVLFTIYSINYIFYQDLSYFNQKMIYFSLVTVFITAFGNVVNDFFDIEIDAHKKQSYPAKFFTKNQIITILFFISLIWICLAAYSFFIFRDVLLLFIYFISSLLLFFYSKNIKCTALLGNILVAVFCAEVPLMVWWINREAWIGLGDISSNLKEYTTVWILAYTTFAFLSTLFRELVKDLEDYHSDRLCSCNTAPVQLGVFFSKRLALIFGVILFIQNIIFSYYLYSKKNVIAFILIIIIIIFLLYILLYLYKSLSDRDFHRVSTLTKWMMLMGLLTLFAI